MRIFLTNKLPTEKPVFNSGPEPEPKLVPVKNKATYLMRSTYIIVMCIFLTNKPPTEKATADNREPELMPVDDKAPTSSAVRISSLCGYSQQAPNREAEGGQP